MQEEEVVVEEPPSDDVTPQIPADVTPQVEEETAAMEVSQVSRNMVFVCKWYYIVRYNDCKNTMETLQVKIIVYMCLCLRNKAIHMIYQWKRKFQGR